VSDRLAHHTGRRQFPTADSQTVTLSGAVPPKVRVRAIEEARAQGTSLSRIVSQALVEYLDRRAAT
jgi:predicted HicB family RNase H-like nuclease